MNTPRDRLDPLDPAPPDDAVHAGEYVLGVLEHEERLRVQQRIERCPVCVFLQHAASHHHPSSLRTNAASVTAAEGPVAPGYAMARGHEIMTVDDHAQPLQPCAGITRGEGGLDAQKRVACAKTSRAASRQPCVFY